MFSLDLGVCLCLGNVLTNIQVRREQAEEDGILRLMKNIMHGMLLGMNINLALLLKLKRVVWLPPFAIIPTALAIFTAGLSYLSKKKNYHRDAFEAFDQNIGKWMDVTAVISSIAILVLLAPDVKKFPFGFALIATSVGINALHAFYWYKRA